MLLKEAEQEAPAEQAALFLFRLGLIVVDDFGDDVERDFDDLAVRPLDFDARLGERLRRAQALDRAAHARTVPRYDLDVVLTVERLERRQCFGHFHVSLTVLSPAPARGCPVMGHSVRTVSARQMPREAAGVP